MKVDLNLFRVFEAIYCEGNISKAAAALNLSQPAVSHALAKLRDHYDDRLFIRQGNEMRPTALTKNVIEEVGEWKETGEAENDLDENEPRFVAIG